MDMILRGTAIGKDENGYLNLNDIWRLSGERDTKIPHQWRRLPATRELVSALSNRGFSPISDVIYAKRGNGGGTFAHVILALAYAEYLNPDLGVEVRQIALRVYAGDVSVLDDYRQTKRSQLEDDANRITARDEIRRNNFDLNQLLKSVGAKTGRQWAAFHNKGYEGLYDGLDENAIHSRKNLDREQAILDHMGFAELAYNMYRTALAQQFLTKHPVDNVPRACEIHKRMGERVRSDLVELDLDMPEDLPMTDSIKSAQKRLREHQKSLK